ncbi:DUF4129 domain-containing protein [Oceanihabitans sp. 2_MG-2023]|nr:DUF4129 domain-containing protein [Oceanihabitans sp. 2_MG-2023]
MKKHVLFFMLLISIFGYSQEYDEDYTQVKNDPIVQNKSTNFEEKRAFKSDLKEKYNDKDFIYIDDLKKPEPKVIPENSTSNNFGFLAAFGSFMSYIFPFLLGLVIVLIVLKTFFGTDIAFWNFNKNSNKTAEKLVYEEENIHEADFSKLLEKAILNSDFRLATRYYYLSLLKRLTDNNAIDYHKDKTNTEYVFEIENKQIRKQFADVSYIYNYVWYGEFPIDALTFKTVEKKYKSIFNSMH